MGWDYFIGYEAMVFLLLLHDYCIVPLCCFLILWKRGGDEWTVLWTPLFALGILLTHRVLYTFLFSAAGIEKIFSPVFQLLVSLFILLVCALFRMRETFRRRHWLRRLTTLVLACLCGFLAWLIPLMLLLPLALGHGGASPRYPHLLPALYAVCTVVPAGVGVVLWLLGIIQPAETRKERLCKAGIIFAIMAVCFLLPNSRMPVLPIFV